MVETAAEQPRHLRRIAGRRGIRSLWWHGHHRALACQRGQAVPLRSGVPDLSPSKARGRGQDTSTPPHRPKSRSKAKVKTAGEPGTPPAAPTKRPGFQIPLHPLLPSPRANDGTGNPPVTGEGARYPLWSPITTLTEEPAPVDAWCRYAASSVGQARRR